MKNFFIKSGKHSSGFHFGITFKKTIKYNCFFDISCLYHFGDADDKDINKLFGFSTTLYHHHTSARIGWRSVNDTHFELLTYTYVEGVRSNNSIVLGTVVPGELFECSITDNEDHYLYSFSKRMFSNSFKVPKTKDWLPWKYLLWPFFGGNKPAPHDMSIKMKRLD